MPEERRTAQTIILGGRTIAYTIRRSRRAKHLGLRVTPMRGLEIVVPARGRLPDVPALLRDRATWILGALDRVAVARPAASAPLIGGALLPYRGEDYRLDVRAGGRKRPLVARDEATRTIVATLPGATTTLAPVLETWYRAEARVILAERVHVYAAELGVTYARLTIRDGRSRWGSCSSRGGLNFSWRLVLAPPDILDYVVIHELAHRRELNHSPRFWAIVATHCPDYRLHQRWLREHGARLMAFLTTTS